MKCLIKKSLLICIVIFPIFNCNTFTENIVPDKSSELESGNVLFNSWSLYSEGLYYKDAGEFTMAIKYFMDAATFREELQRIYYQIAECYFYLNNYDTAINYSEMAIKADKKYSKPYLLLNKIYLNLNDTKKGVEILEELVSVHPEMINIHYSIGLLYYKLKKYDKAIVSFRNILEIANAVPVEDYYKENANYYIARIYYYENLIDRTIEHLENVVNINPDNKVALYLLSNILMETYQFEKARVYSLQYINRYRSNYVVYSNLGRIYYLEDNPKAKEYLRYAMNNKAIYGEISRALYFELMHKDKEAGTLLRNVILGNPLLVSSHKALAKIAIRANDKKTATSELFTAGLMTYKAGQYDIARALLTKVLSINDKVPEVYFYIGKIYEETHQINLSISYFKKTNKLKSSPELQIHIGYLYSQLNDFKEAIKYIDMAIEQDPNNPKSYFFKGLAFSRNNDFSEAEKLIKKAIELKKKDDTYYFYLATVQEKQNKIEDTINSLKKAIEYNPENAMVYNYLGYLYAEMNINLDESVELIQKALVLSPMNGAFLDSLGWAYYKKGNIKLALKKLLQAERQLDKDKSPDAVVYDHIGDAYHKIGERGKAVEYWKKSVNLQQNSDIQEKIKEISGN